MSILGTLLILDLWDTDSEKVKRQKKENTKKVLEAWQVWLDKSQGN